MNKKNFVPKTGVLTNSIDPRNKEFVDLKLVLEKKAHELSEEQKLLLESYSLQVKMENYLEQDSSGETLITSGEFLRLFLKNLKIRQNKFAKYIGLKPSNLSKLLSGDRKLSIDLSLVLGSIFNMDPDLWLNIQTKNELIRLAESEKKDYSKFNLNDLVKE